MDALLHVYPVTAILLPVLSVPLIAFFFVRRSDRVLGRSFVVGWLCAFVAIVACLTMAAIEEEMAAYNWLLLYTPASAIASFFGGFAIFYVIASRHSKKQKPPPQHPAHR